MGQLVTRPHFVSDRDATIERLIPGRTVGELIANVHCAPEMREYMVCFINGQLVEDWDTLPNDGDHVLIGAVPHGGGGGKDILRLVAIAALTYATVGIGGAGGFVANTFGATAAVGTFVAGTLAIGALFPPPSINAGPGIANESPALNIQGQRNQIRPYQPVNRIYGMHRVHPPHCAEPYVLNHGFRDKYLHMILDIGVGKYDLRNWKIGETPLSDYEGVEKWEHYGKGPEINFVRYAGVVRTDTYSHDLKQGNAIIERSRAGTNSVIIDITFPQGLTGFSKDGDKIWRDVDFSVEYKRSSAGTWNRFGLADWDVSRKRMKVTEQLGLPGLVPWTPFNSLTTPANASPVGTIIRFEGQEFDIYDGGEGPDDPNQPAGSTHPTVGFEKGSTTLRGTPDNDISANSQIIINGVQYTITNTLAAGILGNINITPALVDDFITVQYEWDSDTNTWVKLSNYEAAGAVIYNRPLNLNIEGGTLVPFSCSLTLIFDSLDTWDIRVTRRSADPDQEDTLYGTSQSVWTAMRSISTESPVNFEEEHTLVELRIKATDQLSGTIDTVNCIAHSILKNNRLGTTEGKTRNPAWMVRDILTGPNTPNPVAWDDVDHDSIAAFATWCNQRTTAGDPTTNVDEARFRCDVVVDYNTTVWELAKSVAAVGRGNLTQIDGKYAVIFDEEPQIPVQLLTPMNSWGFRGLRTFAEIPDALKMTFVDRNTWQQAERNVYNAGFDENNFVTSENINLFGVIRATQAWRDGRYQLFQAILRQEQYEVNMDVENLVATRGSYVQVQHEAFRIGGLPARVKAINGNQITATEEFVPAVGTGWRMTIREVRNNANDLVDYDITSRVDDYTVELSSAPTCAVGDLLVYGLVDIVTDDFLVAAVTPGPDLTATLTLTNLAREVYSSDYGDVPIWDPVIAPPIGVMPSAVTDERAEQSVVSYIDRFPMTSLRLLWNHSDQHVTASYEIYRYYNDDWELMGHTEETLYTVFEAEPLDGSSELDILVGTELRFKILPVGFGGLKRELETINEFRVTIVGDDIPPGPVQSLSLSQADGQITLDWVPPDDPDLRGFVIRYNYLPIENDTNPFLVAIPENSNILVLNMPWNATSVSTVDRPGTYMIAAVDTSGNQGPFVSVNTPVTDLSLHRGITAINEAPLWEGTKENCDKVGDELVMFDPALEAVYTFANSITLGFQQVVRIVSLLEATGNLPGGDPSDRWAVVFEVQYTSGGTVIADWVDLTSVVFMSDGEADETSEWEGFAVKDVSAAQLHFRIRMFSLDGETIVKLSHYNNPFFGHVLAFAVARNEAGNETGVPNGNLTQISYSSNFYEPPDIQVTLLDEPSSASFSVTNVTESGFEITLNGTTNGNFTWQAAGFGRIEDWQSV